jgi:hypothetical protein
MAIEASIVTDAQRAQFRTFGYVVFKQLFRPGEVEDYGQALERALRRVRGGADFNGRQRQEVAPIIEEDPDTFYPLLADDRLMGIVEGLLGEDVLYTGGNDGNLYVGDTRWHVDGGGTFDFDKVKTAFYCDPVSEGKGCLSVIPGSQHLDFCRNLIDAFGRGAYDVWSPDVPGRIPLESTPGDVVAFHHGLWHSSWGGGNHRRMFTFNWCAYPKVNWQETWLSGHVRSVNRRYGKQHITDRLMAWAPPRLRKKLEKTYELAAI